MADLMDEYWEVMGQYKSFFGEIFPLACLRGRSPEEKIELAKKCIAEKKPYRPIKGRVY